MADMVMTTWPDTDMYLPLSAYMAGLVLCYAHLNKSNCKYDLQ